MTLFSNNPIRSAATGIWYLNLLTNLVVLKFANTAAVAITIAHYGTKFMSSLCRKIKFETNDNVNSPRPFMIHTDAFQLTQTAIAIFAIGALLFMWVHSAYFSHTMEMYWVHSHRIMVHHRMEGGMMSQTQEEAALIGILALFWIGKWTTFELSWLLTCSFSVFLIGWKSVVSGKASPMGGTDVAFPPRSKDVCLQDGVYCIYEEYYSW